jgi:hypothetical protein
VPFLGSTRVHLPVGLHRLGHVGHNPDSHGVARAAHSHRVGPRRKHLQRHAYGRTS